MLAAQFKALADPARVTILNRLAAADEVCVCDFVAALDLAQPTVSHHLKVLRDAGLGARRQQGDGDRRDEAGQACRSLDNHCASHSRVCSPWRVMRTSGGVLA